MFTTSTSAVLAATVVDSFPWATYISQKYKTEPLRFSILSRSFQRIPPFSSLKDAALGQMMLARAAGICIEPKDTSSFLIQQQSSIMMVVTCNDRVLGHPTSRSNDDFTTKPDETSERVARGRKDGGG